jgi:D-alanyl-lipoteichoic acid acyltransferase DltB (MBOAT superfamily)
MPQFAKAETFRFNVENLAVGLGIFIIGLAKKVLIADSLITVVNGGFAAPEALAITVSWLVALSYSLQIYFDFSGYSDMAIGLAYMFNVRFPLNFNSPYKARSVIDFWQRWHMTLTRYLTLYIYNPIAIWNARRRIAKGLPMSPDPSKTAGGFLTMIAFPIFVTMALAGAWHGAGRQFLVFGLLHAMYLIINHAWRTFGPSEKETASPLRRYVTVAFQVLLTYVAVVVAQVFFRASSVGEAITLLEGMVGLRGFGGGLATGWVYQFGPLLKYLAMIALYFGIVWFLPNSQQLMASYPVALGKTEGSRFAFLRWNLSPRWGLVSGILAGLAVVDLSKHTEFLYFQF